MYGNVIDALDNLFTEIGELSRLLSSGRFGRALGPTSHVASSKASHASLKDLEAYSVLTATPPH